VELLDEPQAGTLRQGEIDDRQIRLDVLRRGQRRLLRLRLGANLEVGFRVDELADAEPHDGMIVDDQNPSRTPLVRGHPCPFPGAGSCRNVHVTTVPPVFLRSTVNDAPIEFAR